MSRVHGKRFIRHGLTGDRKSPGVLKYTLQKNPPSRRKAVKDGEYPDPRTAFARVLPSENITEDRLCALIAAHTPGANAEYVRYILNTLLHVVTAELKAGRTVTFNKHFTLGLAFKGKIDPERPFDARTLPLYPWVRFAEAFNDACNRDIQIAYNSPLLPPKVKVTKVSKLKESLRLTGDFRNVEGLLADVLCEDGTLIPCNVRPIKNNARSTRPIASQLLLFPSAPIPTGDNKLRLTWFDGAGEEKQHTVKLA